MSVPEDLQAFSRLVLALKDYRKDIVLIGGWAHRLSRLHPLSQGVDFEPLGSEDADMVLEKTVAPRQEDLGDLLRKAGFTEQFFGEKHPPVTHYRLGADGAFYAEFLTPLMGPDKGGTRTIAGVSAQELRHLYILMICPWRVLLKEPEFVVGKKAVEIQIANAASYLAQKVLVLDKRTPDDRAKDILYIHDTLLTFGGSLSKLRQLWLEDILPQVIPAAAKRLPGLVDTVFSGVTDAIRRARDIAVAAGRQQIEPEHIGQVCKRGLVEIFDVP